MRRLNWMAFFLTMLCFPFWGFADSNLQTRKGRLHDKKIVMIIAQHMFHETEFQEPKEIFEREGAEVIVASRSLSMARGGNLKVRPDIVITDIRVEDFAAVVFVGGLGVSEYVDDYQAHKIARDAVKHDKILAAICMAPRVLANAGLLNGKKATSAHRYDIEAKGAICTNEPVARDGNIITASGPNAAQQFGEEIVSALSSL